LTGASQQKREIHQRVVLDIDLCIECHACAAACYYHHNNMPIVNFGGCDSVVLPVVCRQCEAAACVDACPNGAMRTDEFGVVSRSLFRCTGCLSCALACPFGVITERLQGRQIPKCDFCESRMHYGDEPWCVASCSSGALRLLDPGASEETGLVLLGGRTAGLHPLGRR
jgi:Fe-S-cluster-containing dehydrogenase component